jgi:hypothetical protein
MLTWNVRLQANEQGQFSGEGIALWCFDIDLQAKETAIGILVAAQNREQLIQRERTEMVGEAGAVDIAAIMLKKLLCLVKDFYLLLLLTSKGCQLLLVDFMGTSLRGSTSKHFN